jgi:hypothetical protein
MVGAGGLVNIIVFVKVASALVEIIPTSGKSAL